MDMDYMDATLQVNAFGMTAGGQLRLSECEHINRRECDLRDPLGARFG